jgi:hypothetical protein
MNKQLEDFYKSLNEAVVTTNDFEDGTKFRKREKVEQFAYCGLNQMYRHYLSFDLDLSGAAFRYEDVGLPPPTIITINPLNTHCHYLYQLKTPVAFHSSSRIKPQQMFEGIQQAMTQQLRADNAYTHFLTKNPIHPRWKVITHAATYDLGDFTEYLEPKILRARPLPDDVSVRGRNDQLFHTIRLWGYRAVHQFNSEEQWHEAMQSQAEGVNQTFDEPLAVKEVHNTAKTTARWIWKHRHELGRRDKVLRFTNESPQERMRQGAHYTNALRSANAIQTLQQAADALRSNGTHIAPLSLQAASGLNIKTVRKYLSQIRQ